ncbi:oxidoreductase [Burkholderia pseudomallei]|nr:oxidoreductase [Burkholderia pseudomallei]
MCLACGASRRCAARDTRHATRDSRHAACARPHVPRPSIRCAGMPAVGAKAMRLPRALNRGPPRSPIRSSQ